MKGFGLGRRWVPALTAASILAGCGASSPLAMPPLTARSAVAHSGNVRRSWMLRDAERINLMYVADTKNNEVNVYTYPAGKVVGTLTGFEGLAFMCADAAGNVFIPNYGREQVLEYAHGGTKPIATLKDRRGRPYSCSIDPKTGNLAVANFSINSSKTGNVVIYRHAKGAPQSYSLQENASLYFCTYDKAGNLFIEGISSPSDGAQATIWEMLSGKPYFGPVTLQSVPAYPNGLQWDGTYLAVGTGTIAGPSSGDTFIYRMQVTHYVAKTIGTTRLPEDGPPANFFIDGSSIVVSGGEMQPKIDFFPYPAGGAPTKTLTQTSPYGVVLSAAAH